LPGFVWHGTPTAATLAQRRHTPGLPRIEQDREANQSHSNTEQNRELFELHAALNCKKGARSSPVRRT